MFDTVTVIGAGRAGSAIAARLRERGVAVGEDGELRLLCVPDRAIGEVARSIDPGPWVAHVSGGTPLAALEPHVRRFSVHPLQTLVRARGPEQLDGAWGAVTAEDDDARDAGARGSPSRSACARSRSPTTGARSTTPARRSPRTSSSRSTASPRGLFEEAGAPPEALVPLMQRTIENGFELTGPIARGDWETVERHRDALRGTGFEQAYDALAEATRHVIVARTIGELDLPRHGIVGLVPTMGALHGGHPALFRAARPECDVLVACLFVNPAQFSASTDLAAYPRDFDRDGALAEADGVDVLFAPSRGDVPARLRDVGRAGGRGGRPRGRIAPALPRRRDGLPEALQHRAPADRVVRPQGRAAGRCPEAARARPQRRGGDPRRRHGARLRRARALVAQSRCSRPRSARGRSRSRARSTRATPTPPARVLAGAGIEPDYVAVADLDGPTLAVAARVGRTRLIDNIPLDEGEHSMTTRPRTPAPGTPAPGKLPLPELAEMKRRGDRIVMITAYDAPSARLADAAGVDLILVGDSAAMVVLGHDSTVPATVDELLMLTRAANRGARAAARDRRPAVRLVPGVGRAGARDGDPLRQGGGADAVKLEGAGRCSRACARSSGPGSR